MVFWMKSAARSISDELNGKLEKALDLGPLAVALVAFLGVGREGLETAIFFYATAQAAGAGNNLPLLGWVVGFAVAVLLGWRIYRPAARTGTVAADRGRCDHVRNRRALGGRIRGRRRDGRAGTRRQPAD